MYVAVFSRHPGYRHLDLQFQPVQRMHIRKDSSGLFQHIVLGNVKIIFMCRQNNLNTLISRCNSAEITQYKH